MVAAPLYNMLDYRAMLGRSRVHDVHPCHSDRRCDYRHVAFGRCPIVIHLGDFLQLAPTGSTSLIADLDELTENGSHRYSERTVSCWLEVQHACQVFRAIPSVFNFQGTKRFVAGDPLVAFLGCMRAGRRIPPEVWASFAHQFAADNSGDLDIRHGQARWRDGYGMAIYWEPLVRWMKSRAMRDALMLGVPVVYLQSWDECSALDANARARLLTVANMHNTGHMHGFLLIHVGMRVRLTAKISTACGLVQEQKATVLDFVFHDTDAERYKSTPSGSVFQPTLMPAAIVLQVDDFEAGVMKSSSDSSAAGLPREIAKTIFFLEPQEQTFTYRSGKYYTVRRVGFHVTHEGYLTSTASQGQTLRTGVTID